MLQYQIETRSDTGLRRSSNQDASGLLRLRHGWLAIVCDGMGGSHGGEVASRITVSSVIEYVKRVALPEGHAALREYVRDALHWANQQVWHHAQKHPSLKKMGTTVVLVLCYHDWAYIAHVGDSRLYLMRQNSLLQITKDHSMVQKLLDAGEISAETAASHPRSNVISRVIGLFQHVDVECQPNPLRLEPSDRLLLCTDGLFRMVDVIDILYQLRDGYAPEQICHHLVDMANRAGGKDNITVQVIFCGPRFSVVLWLGLSCFVIALWFLLLWGWLLSSA